MANILLSIVLSTCVSMVVSRTAGKLHVDIMLSGLEKYSETYPIPRLHYKYDAFEPWLDAKTLEAHHKQVHQERAFQLTRLLKEWRAADVNSTVGKLPLFGLLQNIDKVPVKWREDLRNNIGGYLNHIFYFATLSPNQNGTERNMSETMKSVLMRSFVNVTNFQKMFNKSASQLFSNGYIWLVRVPKQRYLTIFTAHTEMNPVNSGMQPILGIDLWEHSYWTKYGNNREEYIRNWWKLVDYEKVEQILNWWWSFDPYDPKFDAQFHDDYWEL